MTDRLTGGVFFKKMRSVLHQSQFLEFQVCGETELGKNEPNFRFRFRFRFLFDFDSDIKLIDFPPMEVFL